MLTLLSSMAQKKTAPFPKMLRGDDANVRLTKDDFAYLEEPYIPHLIVGAL